MELWIPLTILAAFCQNLRSVVQKRLKDRLTNLGATGSRFFYAAPLAILYALGLGAAGFEAPLPGAGFLALAFVGGVAQILATALLLQIFAYRNFAVGTAFSKTETAQTAIIGFVLLGEVVSLGAGLAILVSLAGVMMISVTERPRSPGDLIRQCTGRPALLGLLSGACFGVAAVSYRAASLSLNSGAVAMRAALTLAIVLVIQSAVMALWLGLREPGQIRALIREWRWAGVAGVAGVLASMCWFTAMTLQNAAYVRALGQVELIFTFAASWWVFGERASRAEVAGVVLITLGLILLVLAR